jgi:diaminopimelate decarboxylase
LGTHPGQRKRLLRQPLDPTTYTPHFAFRHGALCCEGVRLEEAARRHGTPLYVYSAASIRAAYRRLHRAFAGTPHHLCYSVKANSNRAILRLLARQGSYFDIVSGGELYRLQRAGISPRRVVFSGVGKTREEMRMALQAGILLFNVESGAELDMLAQEAARLGRPAAAGLRVNPDVDARTHPHISTGARSHKFGLDWDQAERLYRRYRDSRWIHWQAISAHIGSQILSVKPFAQAAARVAAFVGKLAGHGVQLRFVDFGGGVGIQYTNEQPMSLREYARTLSRLARNLGCRLLLEPGRVIVGPAGVLLMRTLLTKENRGKSFVVVDAAMNDFMRPALYDAMHPITVAGGRNRHAALSAQHFHSADVVGPVCETGDCFLQDWPLPPVQEGDLLVLWGAGAYGSVAASNYNTRPRPAEVLVEGSRLRVVRRRESLRDLTRHES